jgi:hypothetical protein
MQLKILLPFSEDPATIFLSQINPFHILVPSFHWVKYCLSLSRVTYFETPIIEGKVNCISVHEPLMWHVCTQ